MSRQNLWTWKGKFFGYRDGDELWTYKGRHVGRFAGDLVFGRKGEYLGELRGDRLIRHKRGRPTRGSSFTPCSKRVSHTPQTGYVGYVSIVGFEDFPGPLWFEPTRTPSG